MRLWRKERVVEPAQRPPVDRFERENEALCDLLLTLSLYLSRYVWTQLTTEQKELFADIIDAEHRRLDESDGYNEPGMEHMKYTPTDRWWRE